MPGGGVPYHFISFQHGVWTGHGDHRQLLTLTGHTFHWLEQLSRNASQDHALRAGTLSWFGVDITMR